MHFLVSILLNYCQSHLNSGKTNVHLPDTISSVSRVILCDNFEMFTYRLFSEVNASNFFLFTKGSNVF